MVTVTVTGNSPGTEGGKGRAAFSETRVQINYPWPWPCDVIILLEYKNAQDAEKPRIILVYFVTSVVPLSTGTTWTTNRHFYTFNTFLHFEYISDRDRDHHRCALWLIVIVFNKPQKRCRKTKNGLWLEVVWVMYMSVCMHVCTGMHRLIFSTYISFLQKKVYFTWQ